MRCKKLIPGSDIGWVEGVQRHRVTLIGPCCCDMILKILFGVYLGNCKGSEVDTW